MTTSERQEPIRTLIVYYEDVIASVDEYTALWLYMQGTLIKAFKPFIYPEAEINLNVAWKRCPPCQAITSDPAYVNIICIALKRRCCAPWRGTFSFLSKTHDGIRRATFWQIWRVLHSIHKGYLYVTEEWAKFNYKQKNCHRKTKHS